MNIASISSFPGKYIQGSGILDNFADFLDQRFTRVVLLADPIVLGLIKDRIFQSLTKSEREGIVCDFGGESSETAINKLKETALNNNANCIIGAGGGKAIDTARAAAYALGLPVVVVPTIAATDAPISSLAGVYSEGHHHLYTIRTGRNPNMVIVDTQVVVNAPVRFLIAGMGDALSTKFEAEAAFQSGVPNIHGGKPTATALAIAALAFKLIIEHGEAAKEAAANQRVTLDVERVIEANILLSGVGFESGGLAAAHGLHSGFTVLPEAGKTLHGEKVAFTTLVQLQMEEKYANRSNNDFNQLASFYRKVGLPLTLKQLGIEGPKVELVSKIKQVAVKACQKGGYIHNMPFPVNEDLVWKSILAADERGAQYL
jgi:glycerol dehydrogenase